MNTHSVEHRISALVLVIAVSVIGVALPASASGKGKIVAPRQRENRGASPSGPNHRFRQIARHWDKWLYPHLLKADKRSDARQ